MRCEKRSRIAQRSPQSGWSSLARSTGVPELSDEELLKMVEEQGHFRFLDDPQEDIYTWDDGDAK